MPAADAAGADAAATVEPARIVGEVLDGWSAAIAAHDPAGVAACFTVDAVFQGFRPSHSIGRHGIADYYASQPLGLTATYRILDARRVADDVIVAYLAVDFAFVDRPTIPVHLTVVLGRADARWLISHYHVSRIDPA